MRPLEGRHAFVTGGGRGIGRAIATALTQAGAAVTIAGRNEKPLAEVVAKGEAAGSVIADVTDAKTVDNAVKQAVAARGEPNASERPSGGPAPNPVLPSRSLGGYHYGIGPRGGAPLRDRTNAGATTSIPDRVTLLADVAEIVARSHDLHETLGNVVDQLGLERGVHGDSFPWVVAAGSAGEGMVAASAPQSHDVGGRGPRRTPHLAVALGKKSCSPPIL